MSATATPLPAPTRGLQRLGDRLGVNRAVGYTLLTRAWSSVSGPVNVVFLGACLTAAEQGYYYTFLSVSALVMFIELGLGVVLVQFFSHEYARLHWAQPGELGGDAAALGRMASLFRQAGVWYLGVATAAVPLLLVAGWWMFGRSPNPTGVVWLWPWLLTVGTVAFGLAYVPASTLMASCGRNGQLAQANTAGLVAGTLLFWALLAAGAGLYVTTLPALVTYLTVAGWLAVTAHRPARQLWGHRPVGVPGVSWAGEVWPLQWRVAVTWLSSYLAYYAVTPVIFAAQGDVAAGQFGMTLSIGFSVGMIAYSWLSALAPEFGALAGAGRVANLDRRFGRTVAFAGTASAMAASLLVLAVIGLNAADSRYAHKVLPPLPFAVVMVSSLVTAACTAQVTYLRSFKREPLMWVSLAVGAGVLLAVWLLRRAAPLAVAGGILGVNLLVGLGCGTAVFLRVRRRLLAGGAA